MSLYLTRKYRRMVYKATIAVVVFYCALELVFPFIIPYMPLRFQIYLPRNAAFLAQNSKRSLFPRDYVLILGDSYAAGYGDGLLGSGPFGKPRTRPAHFIYDALGVDTVSCGVSGADSVNGMLTVPVNSIACANSRFWFSGLTDRAGMTRPKIVLVFFYEGNDLNDNCKGLRSSGLEHTLDVQLGAVNRYLTNKVCFDTLGGRMNLKDKLYFAGFVINCIYDPEGYRIDKDCWARVPVNSINKVLVGGEEIDVPENLQAPALDLSQEEIDAGIKIFEKAFDAARRLFSGSRIAVVYIPSPLSCYTIAGSHVCVEEYFKGRNCVYPADMVPERSLMIKNRIRAVALERGVDFIDPVPEIRDAAQKQLVHGPKDWMHLNRNGYAAMMKPVTAAVKKIIADDKL